MNLSDEFNKDDEAINSAMVEANNFDLDNIDDELGDWQDSPDDPTHTEVVLITKLFGTLDEAKAWRAEQVTKYAEFEQDEDDEYNYYKRTDGKYEVSFDARKVVYPSSDSTTVH